MTDFLAYIKRHCPILFISIKEVIKEVIKEAIIQLNSNSNQKEEVSLKRIGIGNNHSSNTIQCKTEQEKHEGRKEK
jgi:hypothetical protein